jgi:hypothetical protein
MLTAFAGAPFAGVGSGAPFAGISAGASAGPPTETVAEAGEQTWWPCWLYAALVGGAVPSVQGV